MPARAGRIGAFLIFQELVLGVSHPKLAGGIHKSSFAEASEDIQPSLRERRMAGVLGFEPRNGGTKNRCLTAWRHPNAEAAR